MERVALDNGILAVDVVPEFGARVTSLRDQRTGREWLVQGDLQGSQNDDAVYLGDEARGWDECFPTVAPCLDPDGAGDLRDHGALWGRDWELVSVSATEIACCYYDPLERYAFTRNLRLSGQTLIAEYSVTGEVPEYLYSQHMLLATSPGERIALTGIGPLSYQGDTLPDTDEAFTIQDIDAGIASKAYASAKGWVSAGVTGGLGSLRIGWDGNEIPFFGLWRCYGGWPLPPANGVHQLALEPTTAPADHLEEARALAQVPGISKDKPARWTITTEVFEGPFSEERS